MRGRAIGLGLLGLGAFLLAGALATKLFLVPALVTLPLDQTADPVAIGTGVDFFNLGEQKQFRGLGVVVHQHVIGHADDASAGADAAVAKVENATIDGLTLTFPFHTGKQTYQVFDSSANKAFPARFKSVER